MKMERVHVLKALVGSHNYNLQTPESDRDYKVFTMPTFDDLYKGKMYAKSTVGKMFDYDHHDVRKLAELFWKANINFIEVLYSKEVAILNEHIKKVLAMREHLVTMNLPYLYKACKGMFYEKMKRLDKPTEGTAHLIEKHGYNTKEALHAFRVLDFITRFSYTDFTDFEWAMTYNDVPRGFDHKSPRDRMLEIKNGEYSRAHFEQLINLKMYHFEKFKDIYSGYTPNADARQELEDIIYKMIYEKYNLNAKESIMEE
jgi:predicted nucleotidyltransferase